LSCFF